MPFREAVDIVGARTPIGSAMLSSEWQDVPVALRMRAFFSSEVESVRFLQRGRDAISDFLQGNREVLADGQTVLRTGSRAAFVDLMREFALAEGMGPVDESQAGGLKDITSERRLGLVFDTQVRQADDYGYWRQGMDPDVLDAFPAQRFIRVRAVRQERESHQRFENQVYLKTDPIWAKTINEDFGVPWGPWAWGCGHDVEDVGRPEAEELSLLKPGQEVKPDVQSFNENLRASTNGLDPDLLKKLQGELGDQLVIEGDEMRWAPSGAAIPPAGGGIALPRGEAEQTAPIPSIEENQSPVSDALDLKVTGNLAEKVRATLAAIDQVHDDGDLPQIPLKKSNGPAYGSFMAASSSRGLEAASIEVKAGGAWPTLTTAHEIGHFLDLEAIGTKGDFASKSGNPLMRRVLEAASKTEAIQGLQSRITNATSYRVLKYVRYLLSKEEIWARAYSQYIAEKSGNKAMLADLHKAIEAKAHRQWTAEDFKPVSDAIDKMFKELGWL